MSCDGVELYRRQCSTPMAASSPAFAPCVGPVGSLRRTRNVVCRRSRVFEPERLRTRVRPNIAMVADPPGADDDGSVGVNVAKYASQRSIMSTDKDVTPEEINQLFIKCGKVVRDALCQRRAAQGTVLHLDSTID